MRAFQSLGFFAALATMSLGMAAGCGSASEPAPGATGLSSSSAQDSSTQAQGTGPSGGATTQAELDTSASGSSEAGEPTQIDLRIQFEAKVGAAPFRCGQTFPKVGTSQSTIDPVDFRFYVHNLRLLDAQGKEVPAIIPEREVWQAQGVALLDFENDEGSCRFGGDAGLNSVITARVPAGRYKGLRFTLGVPAALNHQDPLGLGAPFQSGGMQWNWLTGFKFLALEYRSGESSGLLHIGSTACTGGGPQEVTCRKSNRAEVFFPDFEPGVSRIAADLGAVFAKSDLSVDQICHSDEQSCVPMFAQAGVAWDSGVALDAQSFFSIAGLGADQTR